MPVGPQADQRKPTHTDDRGSVRTIGCSFEQRCRRGKEGTWRCASACCFLCQDRQGKRSVRLVRCDSWHLRKADFPPSAYLWRCEGRDSRTGKGKLGAHKAEGSTEKDSPWRCSRVVAIDNKGLSYAGQGPWRWFRLGQARASVGQT